MQVLVQQIGYELSKVDSDSFMIENDRLFFAHKLPEVLMLRWALATRNISLIDSSYFVVK